VKAVRRKPGSQPRKYCFLTADMTRPDTFEFRCCLDSRYGAIGGCEAWQFWPEASAARALLMLREILQRDEIHSLFSIEFP
jgi:hypothetical protein